MPATPLVRLPLPTREEQAAAERLIRDVYGKQYADRTPAGRVALAADLLRQANDPGNTPAAQFVLLRDSGDFSARAGDARTAMRAVDAAVRRYALRPVDELKVREAGLTHAARAAADPDVQRWIAAQAVGLSSTALGLEHFDVAERLAGAAEVASARSKDYPSAKAAVAAARDARAGRAAADALAKNPHDATASLALGRYQCFVLADWAGGLPLLAKGTDGELRALAQRSLALSETAAPDQVLADANAWWDWAERQPPNVKAAARGRAAAAYRRIAPQLAGLNKELAARRAAEVPDAAPAVELVATRLDRGADDGGLAIAPTPAPPGAVLPETAVTRPPPATPPATVAPSGPAVPPAATIPPARPTSPAPAVTAAAAAAGADGVLVAAAVTGKRGVAEPGPQVVPFDAPAGDGRGGAKGVLVRAPAGWEAAGTAWSFKYTRTGSAFGLQIVHPLGDGQVVVHVNPKAIGTSHPKAWAGIGYGGGDTKAVTRTPAFDAIFPLQSDEAYAVESRLARDGAYALAVNGQVVATARFEPAAASPLSLVIEEGTRPTATSSWAKKEFKALGGGPELPQRLAAGDAALIVGPLDGGLHACTDVRLRPARD